MHRYDPFGTLLAKTGTFDQPFQFSTKRADARIGMVQYEFRNYLPSIGRWMTRDPLGEAGGLNLYAFVESSQTSTPIRELFRERKLKRALLNTAKT